MAARSVAIVVFIPLLQFKYIHNREPQFGDSKIIGVSFLHSETAFATGVFVIPHVGIAGTDLRLYVPMAGKCPLITVGHADTGKGTLITGVFHGFAKIKSANETSGQRKIDIGGVQLPSHGVHTKEMTAESGTQPPAVFRHQHPVLGETLAVAVGIEAPGVKTVDKINSGFTSDTDLDTDIGRGCGII